MNIKYLTASLFVTGIIILLSSIPNKSLPGDGSASLQLISNLAHIPTYALLSFLWINTFAKNRTRNTLNKYIVIVLSGLLLFALTDELHQSFVPGRTASFMDIFLNTVGIFLGWMLFRCLHSKKAPSNV